MYDSDCWVGMKKHKIRNEISSWRDTLVYEECMIDKPLVRKVHAAQVCWFGHVLLDECQVNV